MMYHDVALWLRGSVTRDRWMGEARFLFGTSYEHSAFQIEVRGREIRRPFVDWTKFHFPLLGTTDCSGLSRCRDAPLLLLRLTYHLSSYYTTHTSWNPTRFAIVGFERTSSI